MTTTTTIANDPSAVTVTPCPLDSEERVSWAILASSPKATCGQIRVWLDHIAECGPCAAAYKRTRAFMHPLLSSPAASLSSTSSCRSPILPG